MLLFVFSLICIVSRVSAAVHLALPVSKHPYDGPRMMVMATDIPATAAATATVVFKNTLTEQAYEYHVTTSELFTGTQLQLDRAAPSSNNKKNHLFATTTKLPKGAYSVHVSIPDTLRVDLTHESSAVQDVIIGPPGYTPYEPGPLPPPPPPPDTATKHRPASWLVWLLIIGIPVVGGLILWLLYWLCKRGAVQSRYSRK